MSRARDLFCPPNVVTRLAGFGLVLFVAVVAPARWAADFARLEQARRLAAPVVPPESVLTVLVRPERAGTLARRASLRLDREIAEGVAQLAGKQARLVYETDESRMVARLLAGEVDLVAAGLSVTPDRRDRVGFSLAYGVAEGFRPVALAVRPDDPELRRLANEFLISRALIGDDDQKFTDDLDGIRQRGELRVLAERGPASYFVHGGEERGFEYELMKRFADRAGLDLKFVVPPARSDLVPWLLQGKGDVIASGFAVTPTRAGEVAFTRPYVNAQQVIVVREGDRVRDLDDLRGRTVHVRASSAHYETLRELRQFDDDFEIELVPEAFGLEEILAFVEDGTWDVTVCDSHVLEMERAAGRRLRAAFPVKAVRHAWAVRPQNRALRASLDEFVRDEYRSADYNVIRRRYFESPRAIASVRDDYRADVSGRISPWDDLIRSHSEQVGLDWRLVAAQMYQESRFNDRSVSPAGAAGLMQLMPGTASDLGVEERHDPDDSIRAGTQYLSWLMERFDPDLPLETRIRFALASYNAGFGHVDDARRLAARLGWSPDCWYGGVEKALLLLRYPEYYRDSRYGYCRGEETARYVAEIDRRYRAYVENVPVPPLTVATAGEEVSDRS